MVKGPRRSRSNYSVNLRCHGKTLKERSDSEKFKKLFIISLGIYFYVNPDNPNGLNIPLFCALNYARINPYLELHNPVFVRRHRTADTFNDYELYEMRITDRNHVPKLLAALQIPPVWRCPNGTIMEREEGLLLWFYKTSFPTRLVTLQKIFGREYSQLSRVLKEVWMFLNNRWKHLVTNNIPYEVSRFPMYNVCVRRKFSKLFPNTPMPARWRRIALFSDGTKLQINRDVPVNYSGHKRIYCLSLLLTTAPDGRIADVYGPKAGRRTDHAMQNMSNLSQRLVTAQQHEQVTYDSGTDKGFHSAPCIVPMHNNLVNTPVQTMENEMFSPLRVSNEIMIGTTKNNF